MRLTITTRGLKEEDQAIACDYAAKALAMREDHWSQGAIVRWETGFVASVSKTKIGYSVQVWKDDKGVWKDKTA